MPLRLTAFKGSPLTLPCREPTSQYRSLSPVPVNHINQCMISQSTTGPKTYPQVFDVVQVDMWAVKVVTPANENKLVHRIQSIQLGLGRVAH